MPDVEPGLGSACITAIGSDPVCAMYRFEIALRAMIARSWCSAIIHPVTGGALEFHPNNPLLIQRHVALNAATVHVMRANKCQFIHDIDDLLWDIPADNPNRGALTPLMLANMDASLRLADVVTASTEPLAFALEARGIPAVIVPNLLDPADWSVAPRRAPRSRLRIGWYGQRTVHNEDLNVIEALVNALAREADFVFYGDIPPRLQSRKTEFEVYGQTTIELFPTMLARLDLDLLLSPLAVNAFNECKSNLRLLQAGMMGYAVIATDIEPHRTLPVTLVDNTPGAWIRAVRERIGEIGAVHAEGRALQAAVNERYLLDDAWAERIFTTWTGRAPATAA